MNKKAQVGMGQMIMVFVLVIVGLTLFVTTAQTVGTSVNTVTRANETTTVGLNESVTDLVGQELLSTPVVYNGTEALLSGNYTIDEGLSATNGVKTIRYTVLATTYQSLPLNISYSYGPDGYIDSSGGRAIASLIPLFFALGIAIITLGPTIKNKLLGN